MKKLISIVLAVMTLMGLMIPVFAGAEGNIRYVNCSITVRGLVIPPAQISVQILSTLFLITPVIMKSFLPF